MADGARAPNGGAGAPAGGARAPEEGVDPWNERFGLDRGDSPIPPYNGLPPPILRAFAGADGYHDPNEIIDLATPRYILVSDAMCLIRDFPAEEPQVATVVIPLWWVLENHPEIDIQRIGFLLSHGYTFTHQECHDNGFIIQYGEEDALRRQNVIHGRAVGLRNNSP